MKNQFFISVLFLIMSDAILLAAERDDLAIFNDGIAFFEKGDKVQADNPDSALILYRQAANRFEFLIQKRDIKNGWLYYNLGNSYFRMGELGQAIYHYRKAQAYLPYHRDLKHNLNYAQTLVQDSYDKNNKSRYTALMDQIKALPTWLKIIILCLGSTFFYVLLSPPVSSRISSLYKGLAGLFYASVVLIFMLAVLHTPRRGIILKNSVIAKKGNSLVYEDAFYNDLHQGTEFNVLEQRGSWIKGELPDGKVGWFEAVNVGVVE